jgi:O-antigen ligase
MSAAPMPAVPSRGGGLAAAAAWSFVLYVAVLPWSIAPMSIGVAACVALTALAWARGSGPRWQRSPVDLAGLAWLAALSLAAWFAVDRAASLPRVTKGLMPAIVGLAASHAAAGPRGRRAVATLLVSTATVAALGLALWIGQGASFAARARGMVGHYMTFGGQLLLVIPVAAAIALCARERRWRLGAAAVAALAVAALAATFTRSAWIGLLVALAVILGARRPRGLIVLAILALVAYFAAPGAFGDRLHSAFDLHHPSNRQRLFMWEAGTRMFRDHPLTGVGLQDLHALYERYRSPGATEPAGHLHDVWIQIAATMGVVGLAAFVFLYGALARAATRGLKRQLAHGGLAAGLRLGVTAALAGFLVAGFFEWNFGDEELLHMLYVLVGLAWAARGWEPEPGSR